MLRRFAASAALADRFLPRSHRWGGRRFLAQLIVGFQGHEEHPQLIRA